MALSNALHTKEITTAQVEAVSFGFFSEEEVSMLGAVNPAVSVCIPMPNRLEGPSDGP